MHQNIKNNSNKKEEEEKKKKKRDQRCISQSPLKEETNTAIITLLRAAVNGWQLAKMKKSIPDMSLPWNL